VRGGDSAALMACIKTEADVVGFANFLWRKAMKGV
jgi:hypothetical protein